MNTAIILALDLHEKFGYHIGDPRSPNVGVENEYYDALMAFSRWELDQGIAKSDPVLVAKALGQMAYAISSASVAWGIDLGNVFEAVHNAAMRTPYEPADISKVLALAKSELEALGFGPDSWWSMPTHERQKITEAVGPALEPSPVNLNKLLSEIKADFVAENPGLDPEPTPTQPGYFTSYGCYNFTCLCGRNQSAPALNGSRGGWAKTSKAECMCGKRYDFVFTEVKGRDPAVTYTITDLGEPGSKW